MKDNFIIYAGGYKYQLKQVYVRCIYEMDENNRSLLAGYIHNNLTFSNAKFETYFSKIYMTEDKIYLKLNKGFAWDGATGCPDFKSIQRAACEHDAFYKLMRMGIIPIKYKDEIDQMMIEQCRIDRTPRWLIKCIAFGLKHFSSSAASYKNRRKVFNSP